MARTGSSSSNFNRNAPSHGQTVGTGTTSNQTDVNSELYDIMQGNGAYDPQALGSLFRQTQQFQQAYAEFSSLSDKTWLQRLNSIPNAVTLPQSTWLDDIGLSRKYQEKVQAAWQYMFEQLNALLLEYQSYVNSLPTTQVQQFADAGINSAVTGSGISGSSISQASGSSVDPSSVSSTDTLSGLSQIGGIVSGAVSGVISLANAAANIWKMSDDSSRSWAQLGENKRQFDAQFLFNKESTFANFKHQLSQEGVILQSTSWDEFMDSSDGEFATTDAHWADNPSSRSKALYNSYQEVVQGRRYGPLVADAYDNKQYNPTNGTVVNLSDDGQSASITSANQYGVVLNKGFQAFAELEAQLQMIDMEYQMFTNTFTNVNNLNQQTEVVPALQAQQIAEGEYNAKKALVYLEQFSKWYEQSKAGDPIASFALMQGMADFQWQESVLYVFSDDIMSAVDDKLTDDDGLLGPSVNFFEEAGINPFDSMAVSLKKIIRHFAKRRREAKNNLNQQ